MYLKISEHVVGSQRRQNELDILGSGQLIVFLRVDHHTAEVRMHDLRAEFAQLPHEPLEQLGHEDVHHSVQRGVFQQRVAVAAQVAVQRCEETVRDRVVASRHIVIPLCHNCFEKTTKTKKNHQ